MKNVIICSRVSTDEQAQQGYSLEYQEEIITRYCINKGYNIINSFKEDYSAKDFNRPQWKKIKSLVQERRKKADSIDAIIFLRPDRFSRNLLLSFSEIASLSKIGCEVEFVEGQVDDSNPELLKVTISVCWRKNNRVFGEDANFDGLLTPAEDTNNNGIIDSPVQLVTLIANR